MEGRNIYELIHSRAKRLREMQRDLGFRDPLVITVNLGRRAGHTEAGKLLLESEAGALMVVHTQDQVRQLHHRQVVPDPRVLSHSEVRGLKGQRPTMIILDDHSWIRHPEEFGHTLAPFHSFPGFVEVRLG
jgi:hypothetical protein